MCIAVNLGFKKRTDTWQWKWIIWSQLLSIGCKVNIAKDRQTKSIRIWKRVLQNKKWLGSIPSMYLYGILRICFRNMLCSWLITAPTGALIQLKVIDSYLEDTDGCVGDYVHIHDGKNNHMY